MKLASYYESYIHVEESRVLTIIMKSINEAEEEKWEEEKHAEIEMRKQKKKWRREENETVCNQWKKAAGKMQWGGPFIVQWEAVCQMKYPQWLKSWGSRETCTMKAEADSSI